MKKMITLIVWCLCSNVFLYADKNVERENKEIFALHGIANNSESKGIMSLDPAAYPRVVDECIWWMKKMMNADYWPDEEFVKKNVKLLPANKTGYNKDVVKMSYRKNDRQVTVVQTGGIGARLAIFIHEATAEDVKEVSTAKNFMLSAVNKYMTDSVKKYLFPLVVENQAEKFVARTAPANQKNINFMEGLFDDSGLVLSFQKISFEDTLRANEPLPDEWFSSNEQKVSSSDNEVSEYQKRRTDRMSDIQKK